MRNVLNGVRRALVAAVLSVTLCAPAFSQETIGKPGETPEQRDARM